MKYNNLSRAAKGSAHSERDRSGTTRDRMKCGAGDGADSPTRAHEVREAARPINFAKQNLNEKLRIRRVC
jgi:hypothetical protein